ncbi:MAG: Hsp20/alpha crystallin family protein [Firmicutes bacterium]|nr:Hsp20/alpha crystallin family protein [Bacillota bacterium]
MLRPYKNKLLEDFFGEEFFNSPNILDNNKTGFKVDVKEKENSYLLEAELPGVKKDNINIEYENNYLTISAKREDEFKKEEENYIRRERRLGEFKRSFYIDDVDEDNINATFKDGILEIELIKTEKKKSNKKIEIK